jgi:hypothetical protein
MLSEISSRQFVEWRAYADLEPFDERRADLRAASIVQELRNAFGRDGRRDWTLDESALLFGAAEESAAGPPQGPAPSPAELARERAKRQLNQMAGMYRVRRVKVKKGSRPKRARS